MNPYIQQMLDTQAARTGGIMRRKRANADRFGYYNDLVAEMTRRGWHMMECGGQIVVICSAEPLHLVNRRG